MNDVVAALYVHKNGVYYDIEGVDPWDKDRDARNYSGPNPVVAHPPCNLWVNLTRVNFKRYGGAHNLPANDGGMFAHALACVRMFGGVLEHPASSWAWESFVLRKPREHGWGPCSTAQNAWTCEVWQSAYGHKARKKTWLYYVGPKPPELDWSRKPGTHQCGKFDRNKPSLVGRAASETPRPFAELLVQLARRSSNE